MNQPAPPVDAPIAPDPFGPKPRGARLPNASAAVPLALQIRAKRFPAVGGAPAQTVLADIAFSAAAGSFTALTGPSGIGKSTLLNIVAGLDADYDGEVRGAAGARMGYVFQEPRLLPWRTVEENVRLALEGTGRTPEPGELDELFAAAGLSEARAVFPTRLSLGMARRAGLVRAFAIRPQLLLMDEPFVSLDNDTAARLRRLLTELLTMRPATTLFVTHDLREAVRLAERLLVLGGRPATLLAELPLTLDRNGREDPVAIELATREVEAKLARLAPAALPTPG